MAYTLKKFKTSYVAWILLALLPVINDIFIEIGGRAFAISNVLLIALFLVVFLKICLTRKIRWIKQINLLMGFYIYSTLVSLITSVVYSVRFPSESLYHIVTMLFILAYFSSTKSDMVAFWKTLYIGAVVQMITLITQEISFLRTGIFVTFVLNAQEGRPAAFYSEPAHYCIFAVLVLFSLLFHIDTLNIGEKKRVIASAVISLSIIFSTSSTGLIYLGFVWGTWMLFYKKVRIKYVAMFLVSIASIYIVISTDLIEVAYKHLLTMDLHTVNSGAFRIFRGFDLYFSLPLINKIFGYGVGQTGNIVKSIGFYSLYDNVFTEGSDYVSGLSSIILEAGIVGLVIYVCIIGKIFKKGNINTKLLISLYILLIFSNEILYTPQVFMILLLTLRELDKEHNVCKKKEA